MDETYEEIVRKWYLRLRGDFTDILMSRYHNTEMRLADAENIYQDIFLAIHRNLREGRISADCDWKKYIIRVGLNMASKRYRQIARTSSIDELVGDDNTERLERLQRVTDLLNQLPAEDDDVTFIQDPETQAILKEEIEHSPATAAAIIRGKYFEGLSDAEIAESIPEYRDNGKPVEVNAKAVKARRWLCMNDLIYRVKMSLYNDGIITEKPERRKRNGK